MYDDTGALYASFTTFAGLPQLPPFPPSRQKKDNKNVAAVAPTFRLKYSRYLGEKRYELSNHFGNMLEVITDRGFQIQTTATGYKHTVYYFEPDGLGPKRIMH